MPPHAAIVQLGTNCLGPLEPALTAQGFYVAPINVSAGLETQSSENDLGGLFERSCEQHGRLDLLVLAICADDSCELRLLDEMQQADWERLFELPLLTTFLTLKAASPFLKPGGTVIHVGPSLSLVGAPRLSPLCALVEAQRALLKSTARQWGARQITLNSILVAPTVFSPGLEGVEIAAPPLPVPPTLPEPPTVGDDVAAMIMALQGSAGRRMTGATLCMEGGEWMVP